jgi:hypothetical protein
MKRILFFILILFSFAASAQTDDSSRYTRYKYKYGDKVSRIMADSVFHLPFHDTTFTPNRPGALTFRPQDSLLYQWTGLLWSLLTSSGAGGQTIDEVLTEGNESDIAARLGGLDFLPNGYFRFPARGGDDPLSTPEGTVYYDSTGNNFRGQQGSIFYNFLTSAIVSTDTALGVSNVYLPTQRAIFQHIQNRLDDYLTLSSLSDSLLLYGWQVKYPLQVIDGGDNQDTVTINTDAWNGIALKQWVRDTLTGFSGYTDEQAQDAIGAMVSAEFTYTDATPLLAINAIAQSKITGLPDSLVAHGVRLIALEAAIYTDADARASITLTTTGTSGAATYNSSTGVLNIPQYGGGGSSYTFTNAITESSGTVKLGGALTEATTITGTNTFTFSLANSTNATGSQSAIFSSTRTTRADNDELYLSFLQPDEGGTGTEVGRITSVITDVTNATEDGSLDFSVMVAGTLTREWSMTGSGFGPVSDGGANIGTSTVGVNDIHLVGELNFNNDFQLINNALNQAKFQNASQYWFDNDILPWFNALVPLGSFDRQFSSVYLSTSIRFQETAILTYTTGLITLSGGDFAVPTEVYGAGWNGSNEVPTKDAIYDKIESLAGGGATTLDGLTDVVITAAATGDILYYNGTNWMDQAVATVAISGAYSDLTGKPTIPTITWGTDGQLPFMNVGGTDFIYSSSYTYNSTTGNLKTANGFIAGDGKLYLNPADLTDNYIDFGNDAAGRFTFKNTDGGMSFTIDAGSSFYFNKNTTTALTVGVGINPYVGVGTTGPDRHFHVEVGDGTTGAVTYGTRFTHYTSAGTVATGFGVGTEFELENASGTNRIAAEFTFAWTDATNATEDAEWKLRLIKAGTMTDAMTVSSDGYLTLPSLVSAGDRILFASSSGTVTTGSLGNGMQNSGTDLSTKSYHLNTNTTDYGNVGTGEDNLEVYAVDADLLDVDGKSIVGTYYFTTAANANSKTVTLYFGADQLAQFTSLSSSNSYKSIVTITRTGAATQEVTVEWINSTTGATSVVITSATRTLSSSNDLKFTATATADNDVVQKISHKNVTTNN